MIIVRMLETLKLFFRLLHVIFQTVCGYWRISKIPQPIVSIFGSARTYQDNVYAKQAHELSQKLLAHNISVLTGGGPGIMQAASCDITPTKGSSARILGIGVRGLEGPVDCIKDYFELNYFWARKWLLTQYSQAFVVFPGGFGTLDEVAEILTLMQTKHMPVVPVVFIGVDYWQEFLDWLKNESLHHKMIDPDNLQLFVITDDLNEAFCLIMGQCISSRNP